MFLLFKRDKTRNKSRVFQEYYEPDRLTYVTVSVVIVLFCSPNSVRISLVMISLKNIRDKEDRTLEPMIDPNSEI